MKKTLFIFILLILCSMGAMAYDFTVGGLYYNITGSNTVEVTSENSNSPYYSDNPSGEIIIPASVTNNAGHTYSVTAIGNNAFRFCDKISSIIMPSTITKIGEYAFVYCRGLTSITIPNSVTTILINAFQNCNGLSSIIIGSSVKSIGNGAFAYCAGLSSIILPKSVESIGDEAFHLCGFTSIVCEALTPPSIGAGTFYGASETVKVWVPCGSLSLYQSAQYWKEFTNYKCLVGLDDELKTDITSKIYPNPASDKAVLEIDGLRSQADVGIADVTGRVIKTLVINPEDKKIEIDVRDFAKGVYNVLVHNKDITISKKLIVE